MNLQIEPCIPPTWAKNAHAQTLLGYFLPSEKPKQSAKKINIPLADGDQLVGFYYPGTSHHLVIVFHGLIGSTNSSYMGRTALLALKQNHSVLLVNHRGCGEGEGLARYPYHSGRGDDISEVIQFSRLNFPNKKIVVIGYSLGANSVLSLVTGIRGHYQPDAAIAVNGPTDLKACSESLKKGWNRIYDIHFVNGCKKQIQEKIKKKLITGSFRVSPLANLERIDEVYTAPWGGFKSADDYYAQCSTFSHLQKIKTPTFILMSKDDPFIPWEPYLSAQNNPHVHLHLEEIGGHMGYLCKDKSEWGYRRWMDDVVDQALRELTV